MKKVVYQGVSGAFSYIAAKKFFSSNIKLIGLNKFEDIFKIVSKNKADYGVVPIENSLAGSIYENYDLLNKYKVKVCGEYYLKIELYLLGVKTRLNKNLRLKLLKKVYSHPKAFEQCKNFFEKYNHLEKINLSDTAGAAKFISETNDITLGAIASKICAKLYNLEIIEKHLEDNQENYTRFLIITNQKNYKLNPKSNKCSLIFGLSHIPGSLYHALEIFAKNKINLTKIESRPIPHKPFEYFFFLDFVFRRKKLKDILKILKEFSKKTTFTKILGFYKEGKLKKS